MKFNLRWLNLMPILVVIAAFIIPVVVFAQEVAPAAASFDFSALAKGALAALARGDYFTFAILGGIIVIGAIQFGGRKLHDLIPDTSPLDKPFWFLFETSVGAWVLNAFSTAATTVAMAWIAGGMGVLTFALIKPALGVAFGIGAIWHLFGALKNFKAEWAKTKVIVPPVEEPKKEEPAKTAEEAADKLNKL